MHIPLQVATVIVLAASVLSLAYAAPPPVGTPWEKCRAQAHPKAVSTDTWLVHGQEPPAAVVAPAGEEYQAQARRLQEAVRQATGKELALLKPEDVVEGPCFAFRVAMLKSASEGGRPLVLLGDLSSNPAVARIYMEYFAFEDAAYPGAGGHTVRTLVDPYGLGWNVVVLGGPGPKEVAAATDEYLGTLQTTEGGLRAPYRLSVQWGDSPRTGEIRRREAQIEPALVNWEKYLRPPGSPEYQQANPGKPAHQYVLDLLNIPFAYAALTYGLNGSPALARFAGRCMDVLYENLEWVEARRTAVYDDHYMVEIWLRAWQQVAGSAYLTDQQRERGQVVMAFLAGQMAMYQWDLQSYGTTRYRILSRHEYAGIFAGDALGRYVQRHCDLSGDLAANLTANRANFGVVISTMLQSYCDGFDHKWGLDGSWHLLQAAMEEPRPEYMTSGLARMNADYAALCINNAGQFVNFGAENVGPTEGYDAWQIIGRAALLFPDGPYQALLRERLRKHPYKTFIMSITWLAHWYDTARATDVPVELPLLARAPVSRFMYEDLNAGRGRVYEGVPVLNEVPYEQTFSKLALRGGNDADDQYLLLDGLGGVTYSGNDAGAILEYSRYGEPLLLQVDTKPDPFYQNTVSVSRGDALDPTAVFARLEEMASLGDAQVAQIVTDPVCGAGHRRTLFMERGGHGDQSEYCVVFDDVTVREAGEYVLTCNFRSHGQAALDPAGRTWRVTGDQAALHLQNLALPGSQPLPEYAQSDRVAGASPAEWQYKIRLLRETASGQFAAGETYRFANVFAGVKPDAKAVPEAVALSRDLVAVRGTDTIIYGVPGQGETTVGAMRITATAFRLGPGALSCTGLRKLALNGQTLAEFARPVTLSIQLEGAAAAAFSSPELRPGNAVSGEPLWQATVPLATLAQGVALPDGQRVTMTLTGLAPALAAILRSVPTAGAPAGPATAAGLPPAEVTSTALLPPGPKINAVRLQDLNGDGQPEVIAAREDGHLLAVDSQGRVQWEIATGQSPVLSVWAGDLAGQVTVLGGAQDGWLRAYSASGKPLWQTQNTHLWYGPQPSAYSLAVGDFDGGGKPQIAMGTHGGISLFSATGEFVRFTQVYSHAAWPAGAITIGSARKQTLLVNTWGGGLKLVDPAAGTATDGWGIFWGGFANYQAAQGTLNGELLVVQGSSIGLGCGRLNLQAWAQGQRAGQELWGKASWYRRTDGDCRAVLVQDVNGDGALEIVSGSEAGFLVCYNLTGEILWRRLLGSPLSGLQALPEPWGQAVYVAATEGRGLLFLDRDWRSVGIWRPRDGSPVRQVLGGPAGIVCQTEAGAVEWVMPRR